MHPPTHSRTQALPCWRAPQRLKHVRPRGTSGHRTLRTTSSASLVEGPPDTYNFREDIGDTTRAVVSTHYPDLLDLVESGDLVVVPRPADYQERRSDGYQEPELVFVLGTAHVSRRSVAQVTRLVRAVQPESVVVELCKSRAAIMYNDTAGDDEESSSDASDGGPARQAAAGTRGNRNASNPMSLSGDSFGGAVLRAVSLGGQDALFLRAMLGSLSSRLSEQMGVQPGGEFRAARVAAEEVGAEIVLGDRPIEITLNRAWSALDWRTRWRLGGELLSGMISSSDVLDEELVEQLKQDDAITKIFNDLGKEYPQVMGPLIHERDLYLAWSLKRSKAVNGTKRVVGVVGKGHLRGVVYALRHDSGHLRFKDLVDGKNSKGRDQRQLQGIAARLAIDSAVGLALYGAWVAYTAGQ